MADETRKAEIAITSTFDGKGTDQAVVAQEQLTNSGKGLATTLPDLDAATKAYTVSSEAEYLAIQKAHDALVKRLPVLQAAGKDTADYVKSIEALSAALSTEEALNIAETMEQKAVAAARKEAAAASAIEAAAAKESTAAASLNSTALREIMVVMRELESGRISRLPGSLSILLSQISEIGPALQTGLVVGAAAAFLLFGIVKNIVEEWKKMGEEIQKAAEKAAIPDFIQNIEKQRDAVAAAAADWQSFADAEQNVIDKESSLNAQLTAEISLLQAIERARAALTSAQKELEIAKVQRAEDTGQITPEQAAEQRAEIEKKYIEQQQQDRERAQNEELNARQVALKKAQDQQDQLNKNFQDADAKRRADQAHVDHIGNGADLDKQIQEARQKIGQLEADKNQGIGVFESAGAYAARQKSDQEQIDRLTTHLQQIEQLFAQFQATQTPEFQTKVQADKDAADKARQAADENNKLVAALTKQIADLQAEIAKTRPIEEQTAATKSAAVDESEAGRISKQFQSDAKVIEEYDKSKNPSAELISRAAAAILDMQQILKDHTDLLKAIANLAGLIAELKQAQQRTQNAANAPT